MVTTEQIHIRDPFVFVQDGLYYLYGTTDADCWKGGATGFDAFVSHDLTHWRDGVRVFSPGKGFWGTENFWAPEMHCWRGGYYLFASFKSPGRRRATAILRAGGPLGPFLPWGEDAVTPPEWECLDGTLHVDDCGKPWLVFCHEWVQAGGGTICARRLKEDLSGAAGEAVTLFSASDAGWTRRVTHSSGISGHVTDGPSMYRPACGGLWMLWSSLTGSGYGIGLAVSESGGILGPWRQQERAIFSADGGHGMIFTALSGIKYLAIHSPNQTPDERPLFLKVRERADGLEITG